MNLPSDLKKTVIPNGYTIPNVNGIRRKKNYKSWKPISESDKCSLDYYDDIDSNSNSTSSFETKVIKEHELELKNIASKKVTEWFQKRCSEKILEVPDVVDFEQKAIKASIRHPNRIIRSLTTILYPNLTTILNCEKQHIARTRVKNSKKANCNPKFDKVEIMEELNVEKYEDDKKAYNATMNCSADADADINENPVYLNLNPVSDTELTENRITTIDEKNDDRMSLTVIIEEKKLPTALDEALKKFQEHVATFWALIPEN